MYKLFFTQKLPINLEQAWDFFSSPNNLEKITPKNLSFKIIQGQENENIYAGQIISYTIRPFLNIKINWVTEITAVEKPTYFIDVQRFGPYSFWHHEHRFTSIPEGILMEDTVYYKLPFGIIGKFLHDLKIKKDLNDIFKYRQEVLEKIFGLV